MRNIFSILVLSLWLLTACSTQEGINSESASGGVIVHGYFSPGWIKNTNDFPVRIKYVYVYGGAPIWVATFNPGETRPHYISRGGEGFQIYSLDGVEIGWISPIENGHK